MKTLNVAALVALFATAALGSAQGRPPMGGPGLGRPPMGGPGGGGMRRDPREQADRQTQMMTQMLGLNPVQQKKVHDIMLHAAMESRRITDSRTASLKKVLTAAQMTKMESSMRGMGGGRGAGGGGMRRGG